MRLMLIGLAAFAASSPVLAEPKPQAAILSCNLQLPGDTHFHTNNFNVFDTYIEPVLGPNEPKELVGLPTLRWAISLNDKDALVATRADADRGSQPSVYSFTLFLWKRTGEAKVVAASLGNNAGIPKDPERGICKFVVPPR